MKKICVYGMWHLGLVTASCLAKKGFEVVGLDSFNSNIDKKILSLPIHEPNLKESIEESIVKENLVLSKNGKSALKDASILWITFDTPVDDDNNAYPETVTDKIRDIFPYIYNNTIVIISSQLPVGSTRKLQDEYRTLYPDKNVIFVYSPENLIRGKAIEGFNNPERIIIGTDEGKKTPITEFFRLWINADLVFMSFESAEMVKHTLNSFLALSISFANEVAYICNSVNANYNHVEFALKSDSRIGKKAYLRAGEPYSGGTLARDVNYLHKLSENLELDTPLIKSINLSNELHKKRLK